MNDYQRKRIELEWKNYIHSHFDKPAACRNLEQIRFYIREITLRMESERKLHDYVPDWVYYVLAQYNDAQNRILHTDFQKNYA